MDKYEYKVSADEIKELIAKGQYPQAAEIADTIDWRRVKSVMMLCTISDLYKINRRYEDAKNLLLLAYEKRPGGKTICYSLCELCIKTEEFVQAVNYYKEFVQVAPKDPGRYVLQYKLYEAQDVSLEERIGVLEELKKRDYREKWAYELAYLYHRVGLATRCVEECDELILWFGEGKYVYRAMELKMLHQPLTDVQQEKYDHRFDRYQPPVEEQTVQETSRDTASVAEETPAAKESQELDIQVKTVDVGEYNTINLQAELAAGLKEVLTEGQPDALTRSILEPLMEADTGSFDVQEAEAVEDTEAEVMEGSEVFFGETGDLKDIQAESEKETEKETEKVSDNTAQIVMEQLQKENVERAAEQVLTAQPPKELAGVLSQESDGQISLVVPENEVIEKQITGQMNLQDILIEWERMKKENEEKRKEEVRRHVLQQTGSMFTEFEAAVRDGLLEQLENGKEIDIAEVEEAVLQGQNIEEPTESEGEYGEVEEIEEIEDPEEVAEAVEEESEEVFEVEDEESEEAEAVEEAEEAKSVEEVEEAEEVESAEDVEEAEKAEPVEETEETEEAEKVEEADESEEVEAVEEIEEPESTETVAEEEAKSTEELSADEEKTAPVERDKPRVRALTKEENELFSPFIQSRDGREKLVKAIDSISMAAYTGNVIITGEEGMDTLVLAKNIVREIQMADSNFSGKVAKISGQGLNAKNVDETLEYLKCGALIIQKASGMEAETVKALCKVLQSESFGIIVVLEDTRKVMNKFLEEYSRLAEFFTARVDVEAMSNETLVNYAKQYAREQEYVIDDMGVLALHTRIDEMQTSDHVVTGAEVKEIMDEAISHANRKNIGHFFDILLGKRYDEEDMIILTEKDFV